MTSAKFPDMIFVKTFTRAKRFLGKHLSHQQPKIVKKKAELVVIGNVMAAILVLILITTAKCANYTTIE